MKYTKQGTIWIDGNDNSRANIPIHHWSTTANTCGNHSLYATGGYREVNTIDILCPVCHTYQSIYHSESSPAVIWHDLGTVRHEEWYYAGRCIFIDIIKDV